MDSVAKRLNAMLLETYRQITRLEEDTIVKNRKIDLSISEMHMLESVAKNQEGSTISHIAKDQCITLPSVTVAINKLVKKGYVEKERAIHDGRHVLVRLTRKGRKVNAAHQYFHENMVRNIIKDFNDEETASLMKGIEKLNTFFINKLDKATEVLKKKED